MNKQQKGGVFSQLVLVAALLLVQADAGALNKNNEIQKVKPPKPLLQNDGQKNKNNNGVNTMSVLPLKTEAKFTRSERIKPKIKLFRATSTPTSRAERSTHRSEGSLTPDSGRLGTVFPKEGQRELNGMKELKRFERLNSNDRVGMLKRNDHSLNDRAPSGGIERIESGLPSASGGIERVETGAPSASGGIERVETGAPSAAGGIERVETGAPSAVGGIERVESERSSYGVPGGGDYRGGTRVNHGIHGNPDTATLSNGEEVLLNENIEVKGDGSLHDNATGRNVRVDQKTGETVVTNPDGSEISRTPAPNGGSGNESQGGNDSNDSGSSKAEDNDNNSDADSNDSGDNDTDNSGNESSETDDGGTETGEAETETEEGTTEYGEGTGSYNKAPGAKVIDDFVATKTGEKNDVESATPEPCGDDDGSGRVAEPGLEEGPSCLPGTIQGEEEEEQARPPTVQEHLASRGTGSDDNPRDQVIDPSGFDDQRSEDYNPAMETLEAIDHSVNPGNR
ncbi:MAG: hypothetical protein ACRBBR_11500 [Cellvibrionaceae bacterium]